MYAPDACDEQAGSRSEACRGTACNHRPTDCTSPRLTLGGRVPRRQFSIVVSAFVTVQNVNRNTPLSTTVSPSRVTWSDDDGSEAPARTPPSRRPSLLWAEIRRGPPSRRS